MKVNSQTIIGMVVTLLMVVVLFNILPSFVTQAATSTNTMFTALNNETIVGSAPAAFAANASTYVGWFWVIGPFILVIMIVVGIFLKKGGYRRGRPVYRR